MLTSARREAMAARVTKFLPLIWTCLWRRPSRTLLVVLATTCAFALYGLAWGTVAGVQQMAATQHVAVGPGLPLGAAFLSAIGFGLILFLTASATAQSVRLRLAEFGVLKALGFSHRLIVLLVAMEAILPSLAGAMLGLAAAGPLLPRLIGALPFPPGFPGMTYGPALPASAALLAILLGAASTALPALRIIRLDVATALAGAISSSTAMARAAGPDNAPRETAYAITPGAQGWRHLHRADPHFLRQIAVMTRIGLATLRHRIRGALTVMAALMVVTLVMNPLLILMDSFKAMMAVQGRSGTCPASPARRTARPSSRRVSSPAPASIQNARQPHEASAWTLTDWRFPARRCIRRFTSCRDGAIVPARMRSSWPPAARHSMARRWVRTFTC